MVIGAHRAGLVGLTFAIAWAAGCVSDGGGPANAFDDPFATGSSSGSPAITTVASTIDPGMTAAPVDSSSGAPDDTASDTTMAVSPTATDDTTVGDPTTAGSTDTSGSSSSSGPSSSDEESSSGGSSSSDDGASMTASAGSTTTGSCTPSGVGNYADCLAENQTINTAVCANAAATCIVNDVANPFIGGCAVQNCVDECGCPPAPATGDAPVVCEDLTGDMLPECWLDCSGGDACPDGMFCYIGQVCLWPNMDDGSVPYGDCATLGNGVCGLDAICLVDGPPQTIGVCSESCTTAADCSPAPPGGTAPVACSQLVVESPVSECHLSCGGGQTCPPGMSCFGNLLCAWDV